MQQLIEEITKEQLRTDHPDFRAGDTVRVHVKVVEGVANVFRFLKAL